MSDLYSSIANSNVGRVLLGAINLPIPPVLERWTEGSPFIKGNVLVGAAKPGPVVNTVIQELEDSEAKLHVLSDAPARTSLEDTARSLGLSLNSYTPSREDGMTFKGLIFDATGISNSSELKAVYEFLHPVIRKLGNSGRVVVIGQPPEQIEDTKKATAQRALEGFCRSVGKEVKKGATCQLLYVAEGAENYLPSSLRFFLSPKSAYVSAQVVRIGTGDQVVELDWNKPLSGKTALVTGGSRGIGAAIAETLARDGAQVMVLDIPAMEQDLNQVAAKINGKTLMLDITDAQAPQTIADTLKKEFGGVDIIVHNAGVTRDKTLAGMTDKLWDMVMEINLIAEERINDALLDGQVINSNGRIVCVSSMSGIAGNFGQTNYAMSKAGVIGMVQALSKTLDKGITINAVAPGFIETQMTAAMPFTIREAGRRMNSMLQGGLPIDVAETIAYFANPASNGISGNVVRVCGQSLLGA